jgi:PAS domain S-box-containing protein
MPAMPDQDDDAKDKALNQTPPVPKLRVRSMSGMHTRQPSGAHVRQPSGTHTVWPAVGSGSPATLAESLTYGILLSDGSGVVTSSNPVVRRIFGASDEELEGKPLVDLFEPEGRSNLSSLLVDVLHENRPRELDLVAITRRGSVPVRVAAKGRFDEARRLGEVAWSVREAGSLDPGADVRIQSARVTAFAELGVELGSHVGPLVTGMDRALGAAQKLLNPTRPPEEADRQALRVSLTELASGLQRLQELYTELGRIASETPLRMEAVDASFLLSRAEMLVAESLKVNGVRVQNDMDRSGPRVHADASRLTEIFVNLLRNARNAIIRRRESLAPGLAGGFMGLVVIEAFSKSGFVIIVMTNNGKSVPEELAERVFVPSFSARAPERAGLGLPQTAALMREMGGAVRCKPLGDDGTRFELTLRKID